MRHEPRALEWESHGKLVIVAFTKGNDLSAHGSQDFYQVL